MLYEAQRAIRTECPEIYREDINGRAVNGLPVDCRPKLEPAAISAAVATVRAIPGLELDLTRSLIDDDQKIVQFQTMVRRAGVLQKAVGGDRPASATGVIATRASHSSA